MKADRIEEIRTQANTQGADPYDDAEMLHECLEEIERLKEVVKTAHRAGYQHGMGPCICVDCR